MTNNEIDRLHDVYQKHIDDSETAPLETNEQLRELNRRLDEMTTSSAASERKQMIINAILIVIGMLTLVATIAGIK